MKEPGRFYAITKLFARFYVYIGLCMCCCSIFLSGTDLVKIKDGFKKDKNKKIKAGAAYIMLSFALFQFYLIYRERFG